MCHFNLLLLLLSHFSHVQLCVTPQTAAHQAPPSWDSPGKNTGVGCHFLLQCMKVKSQSEVSCVWPSATPWTAAYQAPPFMGFSRQEYWSHFNLREVFLEEGQESGEGFWGSDIWTGFLSGKWTPGKISRMCKDRRDASVNDTKLHFLNHIFINLKMTYVKNRHWKVRNKERF